MNRLASLGTVLLLVVGCAGLSAPQKFEQGVRSYETAIKGLTFYYDRDGDGLIDRDRSSRERNLVTALVMAGREIRGTGMNLVMECVEYKNNRGVDVCEVETRRVIEAATGTLVQISADLTILFTEDN